MRDEDGCSKTNHTDWAAHSHNITSVRAHRRFPSLVDLQVKSPIGRLLDLPVEPLDLNISEQWIIGGYKLRFSRTPILYLFKSDHDFPGVASDLSGRSTIGSGSWGSKPDFQPVAYMFVFNHLLSVFAAKQNMGSEQNSDGQTAGF